MIESRILPPGLPYSRVLAIQQEEFQRRIDLRRESKQLPQDVVFYVEHNPVVTLGFHGDVSHLVSSSEDLAKNGIEFIKTTRGGDITYHGPGQLTVYPILDLQRLCLGVKQYVSLLEQSVIDTISKFGIKGERIEGRTGVWIGKDSPTERKISAIGIKCSRHVSMHGLALNVGADLSGFSNIVPCGLSKGVTSISREIGRQVTVSEVIPVFHECFTRLLQLHTPSPENS